MIFNWLEEIALLRCKCHIHFCSLPSGDRKRSNSYRIWRRTRSQTLPVGTGTGRLGQFLLESCVWIVKEEKTCQFPAANNVYGQEKLALMVGGLAFLRLFIRLFRRNFVHLLPINQNVNAMKFIGIVPARYFSVFSCVILGICLIRSKEVGLFFSMYSTI